MDPIKLKIKQDLERYWNQYHKIDSRPLLKRLYLQPMVGRKIQQVLNYYWESGNYKGAFYHLETKQRFRNLLIKSLTEKIPEGLAADELVKEISCLSCRRQELIRDLDEQIRLVVNNYQADMFFYTFYNYLLKPTQDLYFLDKKIKQLVNSLPNTCPEYELIKIFNS